jgi:hypothetical protein
MSTKEEKEEAAELRQQLIDREFMPSSLRLPLNCVMDGDEEPGTAKGILEMAKEILKREGL